MHEPIRNPVVGILTGERGGDFYRRMFKHNETIGCTLYLFSPADLKLETGQVIGWKLTNEGKWEQRMFDRPDVVIDRYWGSKRSLYRKIKREAQLNFAERQLPGKWDMYQALWQVRPLRPFLPETRLYQADRLKSMLQQYPLRCTSSPWTVRGGGAF